MFKIMLTDNCLMPFGSYKGKALVEVPAGYLLSLLSRGKCKGELKEYITNNKDVLLKEAGERPAREQEYDPFDRNRW